MTEIALMAEETRARPLHRFRLSDRIFAETTRAAAVTVLLVLGGIVAALVNGAWPALSAFGPNFLFTEAWNPVTERFGALAPIYGTLVTSAIAMAIGVPVSLGI